jgi:excisionase family DNA binding protein
MNTTIEPIADSVAGAAARLGVSRSLLYVLLKNRQLHYVKIRGRTLISREEQNRFLRSLTA